MPDSNVEPDDIDWLAIARLSSNEDATLACSLLQQSDIPCRMVVDTIKGSVIIEIRDAEQKSAAIDILDRLSTDNAQRQVARQLKTPVAGLLFRFPVVVITVLLSVVGALLIRFMPDWEHWLSFQDFLWLSSTRIQFDTLEVSLASGQYWRLITPAFLHFGLFHLAFNSLWVWELGRRIEALSGSIHLLLVLLITAVMANIVQYLLEGPARFGGMSGAVYGLLGYIWLRNRLAPTTLLTVAPGLFVIMVGWLLVCMTGLIDLFLQGSVANGAHLGGLVSGVILGGIFGGLARGKSAQ